MSALETEIVRIAEPVAEAVAERTVRRVLAEAREEEAEGYKRIKNAALYLDISEETIRGWLKQGKIKRYKSGRCVLVKISELVKAE